MMLKNVFTAVFWVQCCQCVFTAVFVCSVVNVFPAVFPGGAVFGSSVVNVESWRSVTTLRGHEGDILDVAWSPGDVWLASASIDNNVIIWNTAKWPGGAKTLCSPSVSLSISLSLVSS